MNKEMSVGIDEPPPTVNLLGIEKAGGLGLFVASAAVSAQVGPFRAGPETFKQIDGASVTKGPVLIGGASFDGDFDESLWRTRRGFCLRRAPENYEPNEYIRAEHLGHSTIS